MLRGGMGIPTSEYKPISIRGWIQDHLKGDPINEVGIRIGDYKPTRMGSRVGFRGSNQKIEKVRAKT